MEIDEQKEQDLRYAAKAALRKRARALRSAIPREGILERSARIAASLEGIERFKSARSVALFYPIRKRNEVDLVDLDARLRERGVRVAYPAIDEETRVMTFRFIDDPSSMVERGLGFLDPGPEAPEATAVDVIVVPALQIDGRGYRIGYGAGYYDRALSRYCPASYAIGVCFDFQLISEVPITEGDFPLHAIVTDSRVVTITP